MNSKSLIGVLLIVLFRFSLVVYSQGSDGLKLIHPGTDSVYFSYKNKPLLSFGGMSDFIFYASEDAYDYKKWADWQAEHGMNHCRAYLPGSWIHIEQFAKENGGAMEKILFPYEETEPGSRKFDLTKFNELYWLRFREQCEYLESKGIIIDLLMLNGWQFWNYNAKTQEINWGGHFFNPENNINHCTEHLSTKDDKNKRLNFYYSLADGHNELFEIQKAWFEKIIEVTHDLDNIYYELIHELGMNYDNWEKTSQFVEAIALAVRAKWKEYNPVRSIILGMDTGHLKGFPFSQSGGFPEEDSEIDWIFTRPYFDIMVFGSVHHTANIREWRKKYKKPYIAQESTDDMGVPWSYRYPNMRNHIRKYFWKLMMVKCQQMDLYMKSLKGLYFKGKPIWFKESDLPGYQHNYDPNGWNEFENDALKLRDFFNNIIDYGSLDFIGHFFITPMGHNCVLSSEKEIIIYVSSWTGLEGLPSDSMGGHIRLADLPFPDGIYKARFFDPKSGFVGSQEIRIRKGSSNFRTIPFIDDMAIQILAGN